MTGEITIRPARKSDASEIALLVNIAAHGGPASGWAQDKDATGTYDPIEVGRMRVMRTSGPFTWRNATMAECDGEVAGMLLGYREPDQAAPAPEDAPPFFVPLYELEGEAAGCWYINMLGVHIGWRGRGIGSKLLDVAQARGLETAAHGLALIVEDVNAGARRLYERRGFGVRAKRPIVPFPDGGPDGADWLLMVKD
ncbi:MAG: GNAT family N-acetyltransferase [Devosia nanyangense]|uniref:GNAT family N-acetyltransferase n=1 Tax=Devosia nanyangense TaxID=1228055 RepID=A0A933KZ84_9HYPH|nr:GNAT family N-acetyltransferase [Devosia nanyangense]